MDVLATTTGLVIVWGTNENGEWNVPPPNEDFVKVAAGWYHNLALKKDGSIVAWERNHDAYGNLVNQCVVPLPNADFVAISAGTDFSLGLKSDHSVVHWGRSESGQNEVPTSGDIIAISAGETHALGLRADHSVVAWGGKISNYGQCNLPPDNSDFKAIAAGGRHSLGLKMDGSIVGWGANYCGQMTPPAGNDFVAIAAGYEFSIGLRTNGELVVFGSDDAGQLTEAPSGIFVAIAAGARHGLALKTDGSIITWGSMDQLVVPTPNSRFFAMAAGDRFSIALQCPIPQTALVDIDPDTLNLKSNGRWITAYITLPDGYNVADIVPASINIVKIEGESCPSEYGQPADLTFPPQIGDRDEDGIPDLTVKFDRQTLVNVLCVDDVAITIEGNLTSGMKFSGTDKIRVINRGK